jgi:hypothetical protein
MNIKELARGIEILRPYYNKPDGYPHGCDHDEFYMRSTDKPLPLEAVEELVALGWFQECGPEDEDFTAKDYQADEGWMAYV